MTTVPTLLLTLSFLSAVSSPSLAFRLQASIPVPVVKPLKGLLCDNGTRYVSADDLCDGRPLCKDGLDESPATCSPEFDCGNTCRLRCPSKSPVTRCFDPTLACNAKPDCPGGGDELPAFCSHFNCSAIERATCPSGIGCFDGRGLCNGTKECADGSDESPELCAAFDCAADGRVKCPAVNGTAVNQCTNTYTLCSGWAFCPYGSDQDPAFCAGFNCASIAKATCPSGVGCLYEGMLCDGKKDCVDGSDEDPAFCAPRPCPPGQEKCPSGVGCKPQGSSTSCDGRRDCLDGSDEDPVFCAAYNCTADGRVKCPGGKSCTFPSTLCNGKFDCPDRSDESVAFCRKYNCTDRINVAGVYGDFCPGGAGCVFYGELCDGETQCLDKTDESPKFCATYDCKKVGKVQCPGKKQCTDEGLLCNGVPDCDDGSDEWPAFCAKFDCKTVDKVSCPVFPGLPPKCVTQFSFCDGIVDCPGGADENPTYCRAYKCPSGTVKCRDGLQCFNPRAACNGIVNCLSDESDEDPAACARYDCYADGRVPCPGGHSCLDNYCRVCTQQRPLCPDGSDQSPFQCSFKNSTGCPPPGKGPIPKCYGGVDGAGLFKRSVLNVNEFRLPNIRPGMA